MKLKFLGCHLSIVLIAKILTTVRFPFEEIKGHYFQLEMTFLVLEVCIL